MKKLYNEVLNVANDPKQLNSSANSHIMYGRFTQSYPVITAMFHSSYKPNV